MNEILDFLIKNWMIVAAVLAGLWLMSKAYKMARRILALSFGILSLIKAIHWILLLFNQLH